MYFFLSLNNYKHLNKIDLIVSLHGESIHNIILKQ